jgi:hypothetical protein
MIDKFPEENRTFETRLIFIGDMFADLFSQTDIMAHCIEHKLGRSFLAYVDELKYSTLNLTGKDPLRVLKNIK